MRFKRRQVQPQQPRQSNTFRILQEGLERECFVSLHFLHSDLLNKALRMPHVIKTHMNCIGASLPSGAVQRSQRERRYRHVECYTCRDCGFSLMERGHFCVDEELYCGKHAQQRCQTANGLHSLPKNT
uniref:LIM zinc-binding domain-containing protein n=1 Tax=Cyprinus carpio TaxID=7962 RepID=A0A8C2FAS3_CYPCA